MSIVALITWIIAASCGLYLVSIWLIEYDKEFQTVAKTRLHPLVLAAHVTLAGGGLVIWVIWFVWWNNYLVWASALALLLAATLGTIMAIRWLGVYRESRGSRRAITEQQAYLVPGNASQSVSRPPGGASSVVTLARPAQVGPPERNFPLPVVIAHGVFALATLTMVWLILFGVGG
jgi:hypothetical protein